MRNILFFLVITIVSCGGEKQKNSEIAIQDVQENKISENKFYFVEIKNGNSSPIVSDIFEDISTLSDDKKYKILDEWTKKLNVTSYSSRDLLSFDSYATASAEREKLIISNQQEKNEEKTVPIKESNDSDQIVAELNNIVKSHCTMQANKEISFDPEFGLFSFGNTTFYIDEVYAKYEFRPNDSYSDHYLYFLCKDNSNCIPGDATNSKSSGILNAFDNKESVKKFILSYVKLQNI